MTEIIDDITNVIAMSPGISIKEVNQIIGVRENITHDVIGFLVKFDFVRILEGKRLVLNETFRPLFENMTR